MHDALALERLRLKFDTIIDCGLFHNFTDEDRLQYIKSLETVLQSGGTIHILCFSDQEPGHHGPRRISQSEIRQTFTGRWQVKNIQEGKFETLFEIPWSWAWVASILYRSD